MYHKKLPRGCYLTPQSHFASPGDAIDSKNNNNNYYLNNIVRTSIKMMEKIY